MWGGASLGEAVIEIREIFQEKIRYYPLGPKNINAIQVEFR